MRFDAPWVFVLLVVPAALGAGAVVAARRRTKAAVRFAHTDVLAEVAPTQSAARRVVPQALAVAALVAMVVGLAGPERVTTVKAKRKQLVLAFDVSNSMKADDVDPDRLTVARRAAEKFLDTAPKDVNIGLVLYSGSVVQSRPPGPDREPLKAALRSAQLGPGTATGEAIFAGLGLLAGAQPTGGAGSSKAKPPVGVIVVLSDGETTRGRPDAVAAQAAKEAGVKVSTIAFGTPGGVITLDGARQPVPYQPESLEEIARSTGGTAAEASDAAKLAEIFTDLKASVTPERKVVHYDRWLFALAFVLSSLAGALSLAWLRRLG